MNTPAPASASPSVAVPHPAGNGSGAAQQACAACKYQRRKCTPDCILAPFFPPEKQRQFINAHRLFGVSNILKIIRQLDPSQRREAMATICYQADARAIDPSGGCFRIVLDLEDQIRRSSAELEVILSHLNRYRTVHAQSLNALPPPRPGLQMGGYINHTNPYPFHQQIMQPNMIMNDNENSHDNNTPSSSRCGEKCFVNGSSSSAPADVVQADVNHKSLVDGSSSSSPHFSEKPINFYRDYDEELKPHLLGMFDCKPPLLSNANEFLYPCSSSRSNPKEDVTNIEDVQEHDLKGAASLFRLQNCNHSGG